MPDIRTSDFGGIPFGNTAGRPTPATGKLYSNGETARLELYTSAGAWENIVQETPGVSSITGSYLESTNSGTITITGTNFVSGCFATAIGTNGVQVNASTTTFNSLVQVTATFTGLSNQHEPYDIKVTNPSNLFGMLIDGLYINANPTWTTAAGSLGSFAEQVAMSVSATAADESAITYSLAGGSTLPSGVTLNSSTGLISGTLPDVASNTTYTFTINATDGLNPAISRTFSFISNAAPTWVTAAGSLGQFLKETSISVTISATDVSDSITYSLASGSTLPSGITLNSSTGVISGTLPSIASNTTYTFTINASDGINTIPRTFNFTSIYLSVSGGILASDATYYYRVFSSNQNLVYSGSLSTDILMVGGGGAGDNDHGGGGGAGGILYHASRSVSSGSYAITVGSGGLSNSGVPLNGENTTLTFGGSVLTAFGGGRGSTSNSDSGGAGGSGGGGGGSNSGTNTRAGGSATQTSNNGGIGYGNNGGTGGGSVGEPGGGGGGAGQPGQPSTSNQAGAGGNGLNTWSTWLSAVASSMSGDTVTVYNNGYIAGGGGGGSTTSGNQVQAAGGLGGGGRGDATTAPGIPGVANTGGGGGSGGNGANGADGGSGVVIVRYLKSAVGE